jgi:hypothetical protein
MALVGIGKHRCVVSSGIHTAQQWERTVFSAVGVLGSLLVPQGSRKRADEQV